MRDTFKNRLNEAMSIRNIKQVDLAEMSGLSKSRINHYVNGLYEAKQDAVYLIAKALNVSESWLMGYSVEMEPNQNYDTDKNGDKDALVKENKGDYEFKTLAAHISDEIGLSEEMALTVIDIAKKLRDAK